MKKIIKFIFILLLISCNHKNKVQEVNEPYVPDTPESSRQTIEIVSKDGDEVKFDMIEIPYADKVTLGNSNEKANKPHIVSLFPYWVSETEVTQELYKAVMGNNPSQNKGFSSELLNGEVESLHPVDSVRWHEAIVFCNKLTKLVEGGVDTEYVYYSNSEFTKWYTIEDAHAKNKKGELSPKPVYANWEKGGFRLPTEAEWEWAALGGEKYKHAGSDNLDEVGWYDFYPEKDKTKRKPHQVKMKKPNAYGLYDMSGNMYEWCWDFYVESYYAEEGKDFGYNPKGSDKGWYHSVRGGCWYLNKRSCEITLRNFNRPYPGSKLVGIRLIRGAKSQ